MTGIESDFCGQTQSHGSHQWMDPFSPGQLSLTRARQCGGYLPQNKHSMALQYISSPTMGLPSGKDAVEYVREAPEDQVRLALEVCIRTARQALSQP